MSDESVQKILKGLENWMTRDSACWFAGVARRTFYEWLKIKEFCAKVEVAEDFWMSYVEWKKKDLIKQSFWPAIQKELESKRRKVYGNKIGLDWWDDWVAIKQSITVKIKK